VLGRLAEATRSGGRIHASFREGDGEIRSTFGTTDAPQCYTDTLWREPELRSQFAAAGWVVDEVGTHGDKPWLAVGASTLRIGSCSHGLLPIWSAR